MPPMSRLKASVVISNNKPFLFIIVFPFAIDCCFQVKGLWSDWSPLSARIPWPPPGNPKVTAPAPIPEPTRTIVWVLRQVRKIPSKLEPFFLSLLSCPFSSPGPLGPRIPLPRSNAVGGRGISVVL